MNRSGRLFLMGHPDEEPNHPGFRGPLLLGPYGVHIDTDNEFLLVHKREGDERESEWLPVERDMLLPWHRVDSIEWDTSEDHS